MGERPTSQIQCSCGWKANHAGTNAAGEGLEAYIEHRLVCSHAVHAHQRAADELTAEGQRLGLYDAGEMATDG